MEDNKDRIIRYHFNNGLSYAEIIVLMRIEQGIYMSIRQLKRNLNRLKLKRRNTWNHRQVEIAIQAELEGSGGNLGCRSMTTRLWCRHGISVGRNTVLEHLRHLDPDGIERRLRHRLSRRQYFSKGPNYLLHVDGYDKVKRFGFAIHGAIDGYSRKVMWLKVGRTNNNPTVIASYFLEWLQENEGVPCCIRMDAGTENVIMTDIQRAFRWFHIDERCGDRSVIIGSSHTNQRIECWWRQLHQLCIAAWKEMFSIMEQNNVFSTTNEIHMECVRYCFTQVLQNELDLVRLEWNSHTIRRQNHQEAPQGKPNILFQHPELYGTKDYKMLIDMEDLTIFREMYPLSDPSGCLTPTRRSLDVLLQRGRKRRPETLHEARDLLPWILNHF